MISDLENSESDSISIPDTILTNDDNSPMLSPIESPLSSARKRHNTHLINEFSEMIKAGIPPEQVIPSFKQKRRRESNLRRSKTVPSITKRVNSSHFVHDSVKGFKSLEFPPSFVEPPKDELGVDWIFDDEYYSVCTSNDESVNISTKEGKQPDLSGELIAFFERQNKLKGKSKRKNKPITAEKEYLQDHTEGSNNGERPEQNLLDQEGFDDFLQRMDKPKVSRKKSNSRQRKKGKGISSTLSSLDRDDFATKRRKRIKRRDRDQCKNSPRSSKRRSRKYSQLPSNVSDSSLKNLADQMSQKSQLSRPKNQVEAGFISGDSQKSINDSLKAMRLAIDVKKPFAKAA